MYGVSTIYIQMMSSTDSASVCVRQKERDCQKDNRPSLPETEVIGVSIYGP